MFIQLKTINSISFCLDYFRENGHQNYDLKLQRTQGSVPSMLLVTKECVGRGGSAAWSMPCVWRVAGSNYP